MSEELPNHRIWGATQPLCLRSYPTIVSEELPNHCILELPNHCVWGNYPTIVSEEVPNLCIFRSDVTFAILAIPTVRAQLIRFLYRAYVAFSLLFNQNRLSGVGLYIRIARSSSEKLPKKRVPAICKGMTAVFGKSLCEWCGLSTIVTQELA